ncbi:MFS transporter [Fretibacterium sp. OH1220_COT-178]|uniref:MFS transporter n=1 Tax=Fretibacterium sp. OH1220_COT-178 TaxID=2491047 RepID=UPI000F5E95A4|nr:MFS transporter [Fretibacterium sp. OH1220_COT-178]RRD65166.1 MFS transporter [Fretibacterium sp. OH1220_COT-178]
MTQAQQRYRGILAAALFVYIAVSWGIVFNVASLLVAPVEQALDLSRKSMLWGMTLRSIFSVLGGFLAGRVFDRFGVVTVMRAIAVLLPLTYSIQAFMTGVLAYYVSLALQAMLVTIGGFIPLSMLVNQWFQTNRGTYNGIVVSGSGIGGILFNLLGGHMIENYGWRNAVMALSAIMALCMILTSFLIIRENRSDIRNTAASLEDLPGISADEALRGGLFWAVAVICCLMGIGISATVISIGSHLADKGYSVAFASAFIGAMMLAMSLGKIVLGVLFDRLGIKRASLFCAASLLAGILGMAILRYRIVFAVIAVGAGIGCSFVSISIPAYVNALFGRRDFSRISGFFQGANGIGAVLSPLLMGFLYETRNSYDSAYLLIAGLVLASMIVMGVCIPGEKKA